MSKLVLTDNAKTVLKSRYLLRDEKGAITETPEELFERVAHAIARVEKTNKTQWEKRFLELMLSRRFMPNSPTLMNAGKKNGQLSACFVLPIADTLEDIFETLKDAALIQQSGGGTGFGFSELRPKGSRVSSSGSGTATGPVGFMRVFDAATDAVKQGGTRRGANMAILRVDHPDIREFIQSKRDQTSITNFNISIGVTNEFMRALEIGGFYDIKDPTSGKVIGKASAPEIFKEAIESAWACGDPGVVFLDRINFFNPTPKLGDMKSTNPCVTGDTRVWTEKKGLVPIRELVAQTPNVSTEHGKDQEFRSVTQVVSNGIRPVLKLKTYEGFEVRLTADHRVMTENGDIPAGELGPGDRIRLIETRTSTINRESRDAREGEVIGWLTGDGHFTDHEKGKPTTVLSFYGEDKRDVGPRMLQTVREIIGDPELSLNDVESRDLAYIRSSRLRSLLASKDVTEGCKRLVPEAVWSGHLDVISGYLRGLFSADGSFQGRIDKGISVRLAASELSLLKEVQILLLHLGIKSVLYTERREAGARMMPDAHGEPKRYLCRAQHELVISKGSIKTFGKAIGFLIGKKQDLLDSVIATYKRGPYKESFYATVESLTPEGSEEVFDLTEPCTQHFHANGILVHNCGEQPLLAYESCNLGSLNLGQYVTEQKFDWKQFRDDIHLAVRFLDNVIDANAYPISETRQITLKNRKIGLGVMGFADALLLLGLPYDSTEAMTLGERVMGYLNSEAKKASAELAKKRGAFPNFKGSLWEKLGYPKLRNATVTTVAPTGTISMIAGASSGIEPIFSGVFYRNVLDGARLLDVHPSVELLLKKHGLKREEITEEEISRRLGAAWRPSSSVSVDAHVRMQAMFQRHSDSAVSKTINLSQSATPEDIGKAYRLAYELGCKGITVYRDQSRGAQVLERPKAIPTQTEPDDACPSC